MIQSTLTYLDNYCERAGDASLWAEPLNAVTNLAFIVAALLAARALLVPSPPGGGLGRGLPQSAESDSAPLLTYPHPPLSSPPLAGGIKGGRGEERRNTLDLWLLTATLFGIGIGSGLWHLFANQHTMLADVIPIAIFINIYLLSALRRLFGFSWLHTLLLWFVYQAVSVAAQITLPADTLHGSVMYLPTFAALATMTGALMRRKSPVARVFLQVMVVWTASLIFRTVDLEICSIFPIGTHFLWHLLNAWVLWRLLMELVRLRKA